MNSDGSILVVDDDAVSRRVIDEALRAAGLDCTCVDGGAKALEVLTKTTPSVVLLDLVMPDPDGYAVLKHLRETPALAEVPVVVLTALDSEDEIQKIFACGADDYVHKPFRPAELVARIRGQMRVRDYVERLSRRERGSQTVLELTQALGSSLDIRNILFTVVQRVADVAHVDRCSIVLVGEAEHLGYVVATSDDEQLRDLPIDLKKYPEIRQVLGNGQTLVIRDAASHPLMEAVRQALPTIEFASVALVPIIHENRPMGVIFLRSRRTVPFATHEMALIQTVANAAAIALRNARILQSLRDETRQSTFARVEAERRVQMFQRYADFFESTADGMLVIDEAGSIVLSNPRAREITGYTETDFMSRKFEHFLAKSEGDRAARLARGFRDGIYPQSVDMRVAAGDGSEIVLSFNFSSVLHEDGAALCTFRDVTVERKIAIELRQTKEFLERVIESSVDAIVSADLRGKVLLFNRAASRIFGYRPENVIGRISVEQLYPKNVAREVMRFIRSPEHGGAGRLEDYRVDMLGATGETIPVKLSAALIEENGKVVGSVGVFTDIRERLRMESRLSKAQEELRAKEKQAALAQLAGTAAHELNQPLTSIIGYSELLRRTTDPAAPAAAAANVIIREAERMADIVRKIGKITKYETQSYVGDAKILDLDKASGEP